MCRRAPGSTTASPEREEGRHGREGALSARLEGAP